MKKCMYRDLDQDDAYAHIKHPFTIIPLPRGDEIFSWTLGSSGSTSVLRSEAVTISLSFCEYQPSSKELDIVHIPTHSLDMFEARLPRLISVSQIVCTKLAKDESQSSYFVLTSVLVVWWCFSLTLCPWISRCLCLLSVLSLRFCRPLELC